MYLLPPAGRSRGSEAPGRRRSWVAGSTKDHRAGRVVVGASGLTCRMMIRGRGAVMVMTRRQVGRGIGFRGWWTGFAFRGWWTGFASSGCGEVGFGRRWRCCRIAFGIPSFSIVRYIVWLCNVEIRGKYNCRGKSKIQELIKYRPHPNPPSVTTSSLVSQLSSEAVYCDESSSSSWTLVTATAATKKKLPSWALTRDRIV